MELKELEMRLACNFASQLNKPLVAKFDSTLPVLFKPILKKQESLASYRPGIEFPKKDSFFSLQPSLLKALPWFLSKIKELTNQRRYKNRYPNLYAFSTNLEKADMHKGDVYPGSLNLQEER